MNTKTYSLNEKTINAILSYLGNEPYIQVAQLITTIQQDIKEITVDNTVPTEDK